MKARKKSGVIRRRALRVAQTRSHPLYLFAVTGPELLEIAEISRVSRDEDGNLIGYQRPEVRQHINNIIDYLDSGEVLFPNSVILALSSGVSFKESRGPKVDDGRAVPGTLEIPIPRDGGTRPAWIVDGQQRTLALSRCKNKNILVPVSAFVADDVDAQRDQFLRINSTKPLPRGLINELLPEVGTVLPPSLSARRAPAALCDLLNRHPDSPFHNLIKRATDAKGERGAAVVADTVIIKMLQESLGTPNGALFAHRSLPENTTDFAAVTAVLFNFWRAVRDTFPDAWGVPPSQSRLMHGVGIRAMGRVMDRVMGSIDGTTSEAYETARRELLRIKPFCHWTQGQWAELGGYGWNELQNVPSHLKMLSNLLLRKLLPTKVETHEVLPA